MSVCIAFLSKDVVSLTQRSLPALINPSFDTFWIDGSRTEDGRAFLLAGGYPVKKIYQDIWGGPDAAIVFALTEMLKAGYDHIGLCEQDVKLPMDWWGSTFALFERGQTEGLKVGAVSARSYEDRILIQRDGYAVMHNLGAGMVIFTREAAQLILSEYRTGWTLDNRLIFSQLTGLDIGRWWAFRGSEHHLTADWNFDAILARHGLVSLALIPSLATMLDQDIQQQGLRYADGRCDLLRNDAAFDRFRAQTEAVRYGKLRLGSFNQLTIFPHEVFGLGGKFSGDWSLQWSQGFGPFAWQAGEANPDYPMLEVPLLGPAELLVSGGAFGGKVCIQDASGYQCSPELPPEGEQRQVLALPIPGSCSYRAVQLTCLMPGVCFYGLRTAHPQPRLLGYRFDYSKLPRAN
jgi:hypothetical protein